MYRHATQEEHIQERNIQNIIIFSSWPSLTNLCILPLRSSPWPLLLELMMIIDQHSGHRTSFCEENHRRRPENYFVIVWFCHDLQPDHEDNNESPNGVFIQEFIHSLNGKEVIVIEGRKSIVSDPSSFSVIPPDHHHLHQSHLQQLYWFRRSVSFLLPVIAYTTWFQRW